MKVKVIASKPDTTKGLEQDSIISLIGKEYDVIFFDQDDNSVNVYEPSYQGEIVLNKREYKIIN